MSLSRTRRWAATAVPLLITNTTVAAANSCLLVANSRLLAANSRLVVAPLVLHGLRLLLAFLLLKGHEPLLRLLHAEQARRVVARKVHLELAARARAGPRLLPADAGGGRSCALEPTKDLVDTWKLRMQARLLELAKKPMKLRSKLELRTAPKKRNRARDRHPPVRFAPTGGEWEQAFESDHH